MAILNDKNNITEKKIHIMVTSLCDRNCPYCCNKQYDLNDIAYVTQDELRKAEEIFITGGEPFLYAAPNKIAYRFKRLYPNIKHVYVYTNAFELSEYLMDGGNLGYIDGVTISIKTPHDKDIFEHYLYNNLDIKCLKSNRVYIFNNLLDEEFIKNTSNMTYSHRTWQKEFTAAPDSIFRKI